MRIVTSFTLQADDVRATQNPKRRIPKQNAPPIEVTKPHQYNNGSIDIIQHRVPPQSSTNTPVSMDEVLINGRRYRVPEQVILLDFWRKVSGGGLHLKPCVFWLSFASSVLTFSRNQICGQSLWVIVATHLAELTLE
jgi:hypothetical protein